jgi:hypothetical protein
MIKYCTIDEDFETEIRNPKLTEMGIIVADIEFTWDDIVPYDRKTENLTIFMSYDMLYTFTYRLNRYFLLQNDIDHFIQFNNNDNYDDFWMYQADFRAPRTEEDKAYQDDLKLSAQLNGIDPTKIKVKPLLLEWDKSNVKVILTCGTPKAGDIKLDNLYESDPEKDNYGTFYMHVHRKANGEPDHTELQYGMAHENNALIKKPHTKEDFIELFKHLWEFHRSRVNYLRSEKPK